MTIGELLVKLGADFSQYNKDLAQAEKQAKAAGLRIGDIFRNALSFTLGMGLFEAIRRGFQTIVGEAVNFNAMMEQARIGFTTMLGSAKKAQAFLDEMADFAARTPFEYPELLDAAKRMMAYGFAAEQVLPLIEAVGNASAGLGLGKQGIDRITLALGQMKAKAKVSGEEMRQLTEAGIPAWEMLAEAMGKTTKEVMEMTSKGLIPAEQAINIFIEGMNKRFPNMMKNMENTWEGVTSTIKDVWRMTIGALASNLFEGVKQWLQGVRDWATEFYYVFRQFGFQAAILHSFGPEVATTINIAIFAIRNFWAITKTAIGAVIRYWAILRPLVFGAVIGFLAFRAVNAVLAVTQRISAALAFTTAILKGESVAVSGVLGVVARAFQIYRLQIHLASLAGIAHVGVIERIKIALYSLYAAIPKVGWALLALAVVASAAFGMWFKYQQSVQNAQFEKMNKALKNQQKALIGTIRPIKDVSAGLNKQAEATKKAGKAASDNLQSFDEIHSIMKDTADASGEISIPSTPMPPMPSPGNIGTGNIGTGNIGIGEIEVPEIDFEQPKTSFGGFVSWITESVRELKNKFLARIQGAIKKLREILGNLKKEIEKTWDKTKAAAVEKWENIKTTIIQKWNNLKSSASTTWENICTTISKKWDNLKSSAGTVWGNIGTTIRQKWDNLKTGASSTWENIRSTIAQKWDNLKSSAPIVWENIKTNIQTRWDNLKTNASNTWENIRSTIRQKWDDIANTARTVWDRVYNNIVNPVKRAQDWLISTWNSIKAKLGEIWNSISSKASSIWKGIGNTIIRFINGAIDAINGMIRGLNKIKISFPSWVPHLGGKTLGFNLQTIGHVPYLAKGGIVTSPTLAMLGEAGTEAVIPLERNTGWIDELARKLATALQGAQVAGAGGDIHVYIGNEQIEAFVYRSMDRRSIRSNGR